MRTGCTRKKHLESRPDHGLLHVKGKRISVIVEAPRRESPDLCAERRCLRFAVVHIHENLLKYGCSVNLTELTKSRWACQNGIVFPSKVPRLGTSPADADTSGRSDAL